MAVRRRQRLDLCDDWLVPPVATDVDDFARELNATRPLRKPALRR
jgi:hypothetical protein